METQPPGDEPKGASQEVYMVLQLEAMGKFTVMAWGGQCTGHVGNIMAPIVKDGSSLWGSLVRRQSEKLKNHHLKHMFV